MWSWQSISKVTNVTAECIPATNELLEIGFYSATTQRGTAVATRYLATGRQAVAHRGSSQLLVLSRSCTPQYRMLDCLAMKFYRVNRPDVVMESFEGELVLVQMKSGNYYSLQGSAPVIWDLIDRGSSVENIGDLLVARHPED